MTLEPKLPIGWEFDEDDDLTIHRKAVIYRRDFLSAALALFEKAKRVELPNADHPQYELVERLQYIQNYLQSKRKEEKNETS